MGSELLQQWSCAEHTATLPNVQDVVGINVFDFDNTLFRTPGPNRMLWNGPSIGKLMSDSTFKGGGWWQNPAFLANIGEGIDTEESRGCEGWFNDDTLKLAERSILQKGVMTVLLTGRKEHLFSTLLLRILRSRNLNFDMVCLKRDHAPDGTHMVNTLAFKKALFKTLLDTYTSTQWMKVYEDRPAHVADFRNFFENYSQKIPPVEVVHVSETPRSLDTHKEVAEVQRIINAHNADIKSRPDDSKAECYRIVSETRFCGYLLSSADQDRLVRLAMSKGVLKDGPDMNWLANCIMIRAGARDDTLLERAGGLGTKVRWRVTGFGSFDSKLWAARCEKVIQDGRYHTDSTVPCVVIAHHKHKARPSDKNYVRNWSRLDVDDMMEFDTVVSEHVTLTIRLEGENGAATHPNKRRRENYANAGPRGQNNGNRSGAAGQRFRGAASHGRGPGGQRGGGRGGSQQRNNAGGGHGRNRGRGGINPYRSLDDSTNRGRNAGGGTGDMPY